MPKAKGADDQDLEQRDVLQAVVLADSFAKNFRPVTWTMPKVLMPLANVPMLEYTMEFLAAGGVQEIFIFCNAHADEVERYIRETQLQKRLATVVLRVLKSNAPCYSPGDALREVEARGGIKSDFVLVPGDVLSNLQLGPLIEAHKARRAVDRDAVLTTVMKRVPTSHHSRRAGEEKLVVLAGETGRLLMYEDVPRRDADHKVPAARNSAQFGAQFSDGSSPRHRCACRRRTCRRRTGCRCGRTCTTRTSTSARRSCSSSSRTTSTGRTSAATSSPACSGSSRCSARRSTPTSSRTSTRRASTTRTRTTR